MLRGVIAGMVALGATLGTGALAASPLKLTWSVQQSWDGLYQYNFTLTLNNQDGSWVPGQGFGWIIFADGGTAASPLSGFVADEGWFPAGPWTGVTMTAGANNGPTLAPQRSTWKPTALGNSISWGGTSPVLVGPQAIRWTSLVTSGGAKQVEGELAVQVPACGPADMNGDGFLDGIDYDLFMAAFESAVMMADFNRDGYVDGIDYDEFQIAFEAGCR